MDYLSAKEKIIVKKDNQFEILAPECYLIDIYRKLS
jgi:hypothetical protein